MAGTSPAVMSTSLPLIALRIIQLEMMADRARGGGLRDGRAHVEPGYPTAGGRAGSTGRVARATPPALDGQRVESLTHDEVVEADARVDATARRKRLSVLQEQLGPAVTALLVVFPAMDAPARTARSGT